MGLLLLLAFLSVAELNPVLQVPLPDKPGTPQNILAARMEFDQHWAFTVTHLDRTEILCQATGIKELAKCMDRQPSMRFLLAPRGEATVQQVVTLLDVCKASGYPCMIAPSRP